MPGRSAEAGDAALLSQEAVYRRGVQGHKAECFGLSKINWSLVPYSFFAGRRVSAACLMLVRMG